MTVPANLVLEAQTGALPVVVYTGPQGGPYVVSGADASGNLILVGNVASGSADAGNPVKIGGKALGATPSNTTASNRIDGWFGLAGQFVTTPVVASATGDGMSGRRCLDPGGNTCVMGVAPALYNGASWDQRRGPTTFKTLAAVSVTSGTPQAAWTPTSGKKFRLMGFMVSLSVAGAVIFKDGGNSNAEIIRTCLMAAGIGQASPAAMGNGILGSAANGVLNIDVTATGTVSGFVFGTEE